MSGQQPIVVHITSSGVDDWQTALQNLANLVQDESVSVPTPPEMIQVVVNGYAVRFPLSTAPEAAEILRMAEAGVEITVCDNSLDRFGYAQDTLAEGVAVVSSGVAAVTRAQQRGATYLKLP